MRHGTGIYEERNNPSASIHQPTIPSLQTLSSKGTQGQGQTTGTALTPSQNPSSEEQTPTPGRDSSKEPQLSVPLQIFNGEWAQDHFLRGTILFLDGSQYKGDIDPEGHYVNGGTYTWPDGSFYTGNYLNNCMHGEGVYSDTQGKEWKGSLKGIMVQDYGQREMSNHVDYN
eukprot:gnl/Chilomastix_caulleri/1823.p1 GENE.gnl/Chilomastix_caulleri/1823~~gnl/Chilomastix_caulleri/1823.p1  ORF type:complete len:171 (+),score=29.73 gnl/Chilomastix_caulleri/1823:166-678(+)